MKKVSLFFAMIFAVSMAMGQNSSTVTQNTNSSDVTATQTGDLNQSDVTQQEGQYHEAQVDQVGNSNILDLLQDNTNTFTDVDQIGDGNTADIFQRSRLFGGAGAVVSSIVLMQEGNGNNADISQDAEAADGGTQTNVANIVQYGNMNNSVVIQSRPTGSGTNTATVDINGSDNNTSVEQVGDGNDSWAIIHGDGNDFDQSANGADNYSYLRAMPLSDDNVMSSEQIGDNNEAYARVNSGDENRVDIMQDGSGNKSYNWTEGSNNQIDIIQTGTGNIAGTHYSIDPGVDQLGDWNQATITQTGSLNVGTILQNGNANSAVITQSN